ncbi:MAG: hypothetical protein HY744_25365 [Deltaproteobacteria bacterium]|nr:hypothetical protein [Deltaproteobacteria bacterium]
MRSCPLVLLALLPLALLGCGADNQPPTLDPLVDGQKAFVNQEFVLRLTAQDPDGDPLAFEFASDLAGVHNRAGITTSGSGTALFHFTPLLADLGDWHFDFIVSDGEDEARQTISISVAQLGEGSGAPVFVQPLGSGTTFDLQKQDCKQQPFEVPVAVEDPDSASVVIDHEEPRIAGSEMTQTGPMTARWTFCPSPQQVTESDRYTLILSADDGQNRKTLKSYLIVLLGGSNPQCPGEAPAIEHTPEDFAGVVDVPVSAQVSDDQGLKYEPLIFYSTAHPGSPPDLGGMTQLTMTLVGGDMQSGSWEAEIPNPVANEPEGSSASLYYAILAQDDDDAQGSCDHTALAPDGDVYEISVTNSGGSGGLGLCEPCTADVQCGGEGDNCVFMGDGHYCFQACSGDGDCPDDYYCSYTEFTSIDKAKARQCIPDSYQCQGGGGQCQDDAGEEDDSALEARLVDLNQGKYTSAGNQICSGDDDWYEVFMYQNETLYATIGFTQTSADEDLDLYIYDETSKNLTGCSELTPLECDPNNGQSGDSNEAISWSIPKNGSRGGQ